MDVKLNVFKEDDNKGSQLVNNFTMGEADFPQFMHLKNKLLIAAENFVREENVSLVLATAFFKDMVEQLKLAYRAG